MAPHYDLPRRGRPATRKALLIGIGYRNSEGESVQEWGPIPTSIPNVKKFKTFLEGILSFSPHTVPNFPSLSAYWGYTDIVMMTDEDGVQERLLPTKINLVRHFP